MSTPRRERFEVPYPKEKKAELPMPPDDDPFFRVSTIARMKKNDTRVHTNATSDILRD